MTSGLALLLAGLAMIGLACGGDGGVGTTTTGEAATTAAARDTTTTGPAAMTTGATVVLADLSGDWDNGSLSLRVNDSGEYVVSSSEDPTEILMGGFVARDGSDINFVTGTTGLCPGQTGVYRAATAGGELTLVLVEDPCQERASGFEQPFSRVTD